jgi:hypothetical protein
MRILWGLVLYLLTGLHTVASASGRFSIEVAPTLSFNKVYYYTKPVCRSQGSVLRISFGASRHFPLQESSSISTGMAYSFGHIGLTRLAEASAPAVNEQYLVHYIWVPILFRLYTSEISIDTSLYFKIGPMPSIFLIRRPTSLLPTGENSLVHMRRLGLFFLLGTGLKYDFGFNNSCTFGLNYCFDVFGVMHKKEDAISGNIFCHNNFICLDLGFLFHGTEKGVVSEKMNDPTKME